MKVHRFLVVIEKANNNYSAYSPDLPGCVANGKCDAVKHCAEYLNIVNHSPEHQVNQKWPYRDVTPPVAAET